jgi:hypothetical protein
MASVGSGHRQHELVVISPDEHCHRWRVGRPDRQAVRHGEVGGTLRGGPEPFSGRLDRKRCLEPIGGLAQRGTEASFVQQWRIYLGRYGAQFLQYSVQLILKFTNAILHRLPTGQGVMLEQTKPQRQGRDP